MSVEEPRHSADLRDSFARDPHLVGGGSRGGGWIHLGLSGPQIGTGSGAELLSLSLVVCQLGLDAPEIPFSCATAVFIVEVLGAPAGRRADELLVAAWVSAGELLAAKAQAFAICEVDDTSLGHSPSPRRADIRAEITCESMT